MKFKIYIFVITIIYVFWTWKDLSIAKTDPLKKEWEQFCKTWMSYVEKYPKALNAGCCHYDHPSNAALKEKYLGDPLLICDLEKYYE